ncbi:MAG: hypothetical protein ACYDFR_03745, partial [Candidatus Omnitrophota bacterium]
FYQSDTPGYSSSVYFTDGVVSLVVNEPRHFNSSKANKNSLVKASSNVKVRFIIFGLSIVLIFILIKFFIRK